MSETNVIRRGSATPGTDYTGVYVQYRNRKTGHTRIEWCGEAHGTWESDIDPAAGIIAALTASTDGYIPYLAVLCIQSQEQTDTWEERDIDLLGDSITRIRERAWRAN